MPTRKRKPNKGDRINWTNPEDETVHENALVIESGGKVIIRDNFGFRREINTRDIDRRPNIPTVKV
jgi:hypothetical protein